MSTHSTGSVCDPYEVVGVLKGEHMRAITAIAISPTLRYLASVDDDIAVLWDLRTKAAVHKVDVLPQSVTGLVTAVCWLSDEKLALGTKRGWFSVTTRQNGASWRNAFAAQLVHGLEVVSLDALCVAHETIEILVGGRSGEVELWLYDIKADTMNRRFTIKSSILVPVAVRLAEWRGEIQGIIFGCNDGTLNIVDKDSGDLLKTWHTSMYLGAADVDTGGNNAVVTGNGGCQMYRLRDGQLLHTRQISSTRTPPIQAAFVDGGACFITGSDQGAVLLFDSSSGKEMARLTHSQNRLITTVAARDYCGKTYIASALTDLHASGDIMLWQRHRRLRQAKSTKTAFRFIAAGIALVVFLTSQMFRHTDTAADTILSWKSRHKASGVLPLDDVWKEAKQSEIGRLKRLLDTEQRAIRVETTPQATDISDSSDSL